MLSARGPAAATACCAGLKPRLCPHVTLYLLSTTTNKVHRCTHKQVAQILSARGPAAAAACCASLEPEQLSALLPLLDRATAGRCLAELYFDSDDPYLSGCRARSA